MSLSCLYRLAYTDNAIKVRYFFARHHSIAGS